MYNEIYHIFIQKKGVNRLRVDVNNYTVRAVYPGIRHFKFCDRVFAQSRMFYEKSMAPLDPHESGLQCGKLINGYNYQNKENKAHYRHEKIK